MSMYGNKGPYEPQYRAVPGQTNMAGVYLTCQRCGETYSIDRVHFCPNQGSSSDQTQYVSTPCPMCGQRHDTTACPPLKVGNPEAFVMPEGTSVPVTGTPPTATMTVYPPDYSDLLERVVGQLGVVARHLGVIAKEMRRLDGVVKSLLGPEPELRDLDIRRLEKQCVQCKTLFTPDYPEQDLCSRECTDAYLASLDYEPTATQVFHRAVCKHPSYRWDVATNQYRCDDCDEPWEKPK